VLVLNTRGEAESKSQVGVHTVGEGVLSLNARGEAWGQRKRRGVHGNTPQDPPLGLNSSRNAPALCVGDLDGGRATRGGGRMIK
jgi:hypothetical protein